MDRQVTYSLAPKSGHTSTRIRARYGSDVPANTHSQLKADYQLSNNLEDRQVVSICSLDRVQNNLKWTANCSTGGSHRGQRYSDPSSNEV